MDDDVIAGLLGSVLDAAFAEGWVPAPTITGLRELIDLNPPEALTHIRTYLDERWDKELRDRDLEGPLDVRPEQVGSAGRGLVAEG